MKTLNKLALGATLTTLASSAIVFATDASQVRNVINEVTQSHKILDEKLNYETISEAVIPTIQTVTQKPVIKKAVNEIKKVTNEITSELVNVTPSIEPKPENFVYEDLYFQTVYLEDNTLEKGQSYLKQEGQNGLLQNGNVLINKIDEIIVIGTKEIDTDQNLYENPIITEAIDVTNAEETLPIVDEIIIEPFVEEIVTENFVTDEIQNVETNIQEVIIEETTNEDSTTPIDNSQPISESVEFVEQDTNFVEVPEIVDTNTITVSEEIVEPIQDTIEPPVEEIPVTVETTLVEQPPIEAPQEVKLQITGGYEANTYPIGQCTWGVKELAPWTHNYWGNGADWAYSAANAGFATGYTPQVGAIASWNDGGYGHVALVTHVDYSTGMIQVLEANIQGKQYIDNHRGWFNPTTVTGLGGGTVTYIYPPGN